MSGERGTVGGVMLAGMLSVLAAVFAASVMFINWFALVREAEQAAELAALAGATAAVSGEPVCAAAESVAHHNDAVLEACEVLGEGRYVVVEITVAAELSPAWPGGPSRVLRTATAGSG